MGWKAIWPDRSVHHGHTIILWADRVARLLAASGGLVIFAVAIAVTYSVVARNLGLGGIRGDFELVAMSCAFAAGLFLPLCQLERGHVMVDLFTARLPRVVNTTLDWIWLACFAVGWALLCWFMIHGLLEMKMYGDRTMLMSLPTWWAFVPAVIGSAAACFIASAQALFPSAFAAKPKG